MKPYIMIAAIATLFLTNASAFKFGGMIRDMKDSAISIKNTTRDSVETIKETNVEFNVKNESSQRSDKEIQIAKYENSIKKLKTELETLHKENAQLSERLSKSQKENSKLAGALDKSISEKNTYYQYLLVISGLFAVLLFTLLFLSMRTFNRTS